MDKTQSAPPLQGKALEHFQNENALLTQARQPPQRGVDFGEKPTQRVPRRGIAVDECNEPYGYREQRDVFPQNDALKHRVFQKQNALGAGDEVQMLFLVSAASQQQARNGPFWRLELKDASVTLEARIWNPLSQQYADIPVGCIAEVEGRADSFRDKIQINVTRLRVLSADELEEVDIAAFLPASARPAQDMLNELEALCRTELTYQPWRTFALGVLQDPDIRPRLLTAPAAKAVHHAWVGGLLEHTLAVATLCLRFCDQYPDLDRQTLFVGALCHDLGKLWELSGGLANDYTDAGRLIGHINLCMEKLEPHILAAGLSPELALHLQHLVLSHHGQYEYGSPRLPQTAEAFALHYADNLDAKLTQNRTLFADLDAGETGWSPYQKTLERALYQAPRTPVTPATDASSAAVDANSASVAQVLPVRPRRAKKSHTSQTSEPTPPTESTTCDSECHPEGDERPQPRTKQCSLL